MDSANARRIQAAAAAGRRLSEWRIEYSLIFRSMYSENCMVSPVAQMSDAQQ